MSRKIILDLRNAPWLGNNVILTGSIRDLQMNNLDVAFDIRTDFREIFSALKFMPLDENDPGVEVVRPNISGRFTNFSLLSDADLALIPSSVFLRIDENIHFRECFDIELLLKTGLSIECHSLRPFLPRFPLTSNPVEKTLGYRGSYWVGNFGYHDAMPQKYWGLQNYQAVIDAIKDKITFVQIGRGDHHAPVPGALNLIDKTTTAELLTLIQSPQCHGFLGGVTGATHICASYQRPAVIIVGGFEPSTFTYYPEQRQFSAIGYLDCCRLRCCFLNKKNCKHWNGDHPACMDLIRPESVIEAILNYENLANNHS